MKKIIVIGTFDGIHLGHKKIISKAIDFAKKTKAKVYVVTFDPHPQQFICPERGLKLLTLLSERKKLLYEMGVDNIYAIKFNRAIKNLSYEEFIEKYLIKKLCADYIFVGYDFAFGWGRLGHAKQLQILGKKLGFGVKIIAPFKYKGHIVKSKEIREDISYGNFSLAVKLLGHPYPIEGKVIKGSGRGKTMGFPTANLKVNPNKLIPAHGVYIGKTENNKRCVINIGARPTFGIGGVAIEVYIINFSGNILDKRLKINLFKRLRPEMQFSDVEKLKKQILKDVEKAKKTAL